MSDLLPAVTASNGHVPEKSRRARRARIEQLLIDGMAETKVASVISEEFGVSPRMTRFDIARLYKSWELSDLKSRGRQMAKFLRRIDRGSAGAERSRNWPSMAAFESLRLRFLERLLPSEEQPLAAIEHGTWARALKAMQEEQEKIRRPSSVRVVE